MILRTQVATVFYSFYDCSVIYSINSYGIDYCEQTIKIIKIHEFHILVGESEKGRR